MHEHKDRHEGHKRASGDTGAFNLEGQDGYDLAKSHHDNHEGVDKDCMEGGPPGQDLSWVE